MNTLKIMFLQAGTVSILLLATVSVTRAQTITLWTGPTNDIYVPADSPGDQLTPNFIFARGDSGGLYNAAQESGATGGISPTNTGWAVGTLDQYNTLSYGPCPLEAGNHPPGYVGTTFVVCLTNVDTGNLIFLQLTLEEWGGQGGGGVGQNDFEYLRTTPAVSLPPPTVTITNPAANAVFAAPANVMVGAAAEESGGTVTNVQFFTNNTSFGSVSAAPFTLTADNLAAGAYSFTAVATAAGISTTSSPVNITVVTPVTVGLTNFALSTGSKFQFSYSANVGLSYMVQRASKLNPGNWITLTTNLAASNPVVFVDVHATNNPAYYRVGRVPNP